MIGERQSLAEILGGIPMSSGNTALLLLSLPGMRFKITQRGGNVQWSSEKSRVGGPVCRIRSGEAGKVLVLERISGPWRVSLSTEIGKIRGTRAEKRSTHTRSSGGVSRRADLSCQVRGKFEKWLAPGKFLSPGSMVCLLQRN